MNRDRLEALLWKRIDGELDAVEDAELESFLSTDSEAARLETEVSDLALRLDRVEKASPPTVLRTHIDQALAEVRPPDHASIAQATHIHRSHRQSWRAHILPLAAGLVLGAAITSLMLPGARRNLDGSEAVGTMVVPAANGSSPTVEIDLDPSIGRLTATYAGPGLEIDLEILNNVTIELRLETPSEPLQLVTADQAASPSSTLIVEGTSLSLQASGPGRHRLVVVLNEPGETIRILANAGGEILAERSVRFETDGSGR